MIGGVVRRRRQASSRSSGDINRQYCTVVDPGFVHASPLEPPRDNECFSGSYDSMSDPLSSLVLQLNVSMRRGIITGKSVWRNLRQALKVVAVIQKVAWRQSQIFGSQRLPKVSKLALFRPIWQPCFQVLILCFYTWFCIGYPYN